MHYRVSMVDCWRRGCRIESGGECFAIFHPKNRTLLPFAAFALLLGLLGGVVGGVAALRLDGRDAPPVAASPAATATADASLGVRSTVDRVLPAVVTVLAQLPSERLEDGRVLERQNVGSGVIVSEDGYVLTASHVVAEADCRQRHRHHRPGPRPGAGSDAGGGLLHRQHDFGAG